MLADKGQKCVQIYEFKLFSCCFDKQVIEINKAALFQDYDPPSWKIQCNVNNANWCFLVGNFR